MSISGNVIAKKSRDTVVVKISKYLMMSPLSVIHLSRCLNLHSTESSFASERIVSSKLKLNERKWKMMLNVFDITDVLLFYFGRVPCIIVIKISTKYGLDWKGPLLL